MKFRSLLLAASMTTLAAGVSQAQTVDLAFVDGTGQNANIVLAVEAVDETGWTGNLEVQYSSTPLSLPETSSYNVEIIIDGNSGDIVLGSALASGAITSSGTINSSLSAGGAMGDTSAEFLIGFSVNTIQTLDIVLPVEITTDLCATDSDTYSITFNIEDDNGTPIFGGTTTGDVITCSDAIVGTVVADAEDTILPLDTPFTTPRTDYYGFLGDTAPLQAVQNVLYSPLTPPGSALDVATVGELSVVFDATSPVMELGATTGANDVLDATDVVSIDWINVYGDITHFATTDVMVAGTAFEDNVAITASPANAGGITPYSLTGAAELGDVFTGGDVTLGLTSADTGEIAEQPLSVIQASVELTLTSGAMISEPFDANLYNIDGLEQEGRRFGPFDWVPGVASATNNAFRLTGLNSNEPAVMDVEFSNCFTGSDGTFPLVIPAANIINGNAYLNSLQLDRANAGYDTCDLGIFLKSAESVDIDRLIINADGSWSSYGDGSNVNYNSGESTTNDGDNLPGSE